MSRIGDDALLAALYNRDQILPPEAATRHQLPTGRITVRCRPPPAGVTAPELRIAFLLLGTSERAPRWINIKCPDWEGIARLLRLTSHSVWVDYQVMVDTGLPFVVVILALVRSVQVFI